MLTFKYWMVASATTITAKCQNGARCFELNAINLETEEEAIAEAARRNECEKAAGHRNVTWFPCKQWEIN